MEINIQALIDGMNMQAQKERANSEQMTLGELIASLKAMPSGAQIANLNSSHSYRGYYSDLAFTLDDGMRPAGDLLDECQKAMGAVFEGYKGGEFVMGAKTPVWVAEWGRCGKKLISLSASGAIEMADDE